MAVTLAGVPVDLSKVEVPAYFISTVEDHIAPWKTTYKGAQYLGSEVRFVLGGSGHIAGIVNPPAAKKYHYWTNETVADSPETWFEGAEQHPGSWWDDWQRWMEQQNGGDKVPARTIDAILDKVNEQGLQSLTDRERKLLEAASK